MDDCGAAVLVRGTADIASAVAVAAVRAGYRVALHDEFAPSATRRGMAFTDAVFDSVATLADLCARRLATVADLDRVLAAGEIPVAVCPFDELLRARGWHALVDARMRKRAVPECQRGLAPLTVGLGPNFIAGDTVDLAIETSWGDRLGAIIAVGPTMPLGGEPQPIGGIARARFIYAPLDGRFETSHAIGDRVADGAVVATIAGTSLHAPFAGIIRGLTRDGIPVTARTKVVEVDPRGDPAAAFGLGTRPQRIADGVVRALSQARVSSAA